MNTKIYCSKTKGARQIASIAPDANGEALLTYLCSAHTGPNDPDGVKCNDGFYYVKSGKERRQHNR